MLDRNDIREHADIIGADGVHVGTVDRVDGERIKLTKADSGGAGYGGGHEGHHHYVPMGLVADIEEDGSVRLSANGDVAVTFEEEEGGSDIAADGAAGGGMAAAAAGDELEDEDEDLDEDDLDDDELDFNEDDEELDDDELDDEEEEDSLTAFDAEDDIGREFVEEHGDMGDGNATDPAEGYTRRRAD
jgi:hypothetical protein